MPQGEIYAVFENETGDIQLHARTLMEIFTRVLTPAAVESMGHLPSADGTVASRDLRRQGIEVEFDPDDIVLKIHTSWPLRKKRRHNLQSHQQALPESAAGAIRPAALSAAFDLFMVQQWLHGDRTAMGEIDAHVNIRGWVLQNRHAYSADAEQNWQRRETRLTKDWPDRWQRLTIGDLSYARGGLMGGRPLSGLSLSTSFDLQPYSLTYPLSQREFFLEQEAQVDVYINGLLRTRLQLPAGRHDILDLPLIQGVNRVTLEITDIMGRSRSLEFFETLEQRLLRSGLADYSFILGVPRNADIQQGIDYETDAPAMSAFYRSGLSRDLTVGAQLELSKEAALAGATGIRKGAWGTLAFNFALSRDKIEDINGAGGILDYLFRRQGWSFNATYRWEERSFANLDQGADDNNTHYSARSSLAFPRVRGWFCSLAVGQHKRWDDEAQSSLRLSLNRTYADAWRISLDLSRQDDGDEEEFDASVRIYWAPAKSRTQGSLGYASRDHARQGEIRYQRIGELGLDARAFHLDADLLRLDGVETSYIHPRLESRLAVTQSRPDAGETIDSQSLSIGTALAYANGRVALSRPLHGQPFVLLSGKASLGEQRVDVIRGLGKQASATLNGKGATAVLPNLSAYYVNEVKLDMSELPIGMQIERDNYSILPAYRSGVSVEVGVEGQVYLIGRLVDRQGRPLGYAVGQIQGPADAPGKPILVFTDEQGHFEAAGVVAGRYEVRIDAPLTYMGELNVPQAVFGRLELGEVVMDQRESHE
jgi:outer membrane usher protein